MRALKGRHVDFICLRGWGTLVSSWWHCEGGDDADEVDLGRLRDRDLYRYQSDTPSCRLDNVSISWLAGKDLAL